MDHESRCWLLITILLVPTATLANPFSDDKTLEGLEAVEVVCDVNIGGAKLLLRRIEVAAIFRGPRPPPRLRTGCAQSEGPLILGVDIGRTKHTAPSAQHRASSRANSTFLKAESPITAIEKQIRSLRPNPKAG